MNNKNSKKKKTSINSSMADKTFDTFNMILMIILCIIIIYPLYYVLVASFTDPTIVNSGVLLLYPKKIFLEGYNRIFHYGPIWSGYLNTIKYTVFGTIVSLIFTITAAYSLSRKDLPYRRPLIFLFTFTMFFSGGLIPLFLVIKNIHIYNTIWAMVLPGAVSVWNLIICRSFFESSIPDELLEAAKMDGCTDFGFFFKMVLPLSSTLITVMIMFYSTGMWNSFMNALMFMGDSEKMPLQVVLRNLILINQTSAMSTDISSAIEKQKLASQLKYGIIVVAAVPLLACYPFLQKYFAKGVMVGSVKG